MEEVLHRFGELIDKHFKVEHDIAFYERELNLQPKYLSKLAKKANSIPPCQILIKKQISHGEHQLLHTNKTVKEIAHEINFEDPYYFSRLFKSKTGLSPSKYRKTHK